MSETQNHQNPVTALVARFVARDAAECAALIRHAQQNDRAWRGWRHFAVYFAEAWPTHTLALPFVLFAYVALITKFLTGD